MGESGYACVMQPFSYVSGIPNEANEVSYSILQLMLIVCPLMRSFYYWSQTMSSIGSRIPLCCIIGTPTSFSRAFHFIWKVYD